MLFNNRVIICLSIKLVPVGFYNFVKTSYNVCDHLVDIWHESTSRHLIVGPPLGTCKPRLRDGTHTFPSKDISRQDDTYEFFFCKFRTYLYRWHYPSRHAAVHVHALVPLVVKTSPGCAIHPVCFVQAYQATVVFLNGAKWRFVRSISYFISSTLARLIWATIFISGSPARCTHVCRDNTSRSYITVWFSLTLNHLTQIPEWTVKTAAVKSGAVIARLGTTRYCLQPNNVKD